MHSRALMLSEYAAGGDGLGGGGRALGFEPGHGGRSYGLEEVRGIAIITVAYCQSCC